VVVSVEPQRAEQQQEAEVPPTVAEGAQMRRATTAIGVEDHRNLADLLPVQGRLDHHFAGEFHARGGQTEPLAAVLAEGPEAAMGIADAGAVE